MGIHKSSVNFQNLICDLAEMYPFEITDVVLVELIANSLDGGASHISIDFNPGKKVLIVTDNGMGMDASVFEEYHDFAAGLKTKGESIGFAGLGAKISFNIANKVITETRNKSFSGGSNWYLKSKKELIWEDIKPTHLHHYGTRVEVRFESDTKPSYYSRDDIIRLLRRHYLPLFDLKFLELYNDLGRYSKKLRFEVDGQVIKPGNVVADFSLGKVKEFIPMKSGKRFGYGIFGVAKSEYPLGADVCGVLLCTLGKIIKSDLFNQFPGSLGPQLFGLVEIPNFVKYLTTSKTDFVHKGRYREFEGLYGPIREEFKTWLKDIGVETSEIVGTDEAIKLERELKKILEDVPELSDFFGFYSRKPVLQPSVIGSTVASMHNGIEPTFPGAVGDGGVGPGPVPVDIGDQPGQALLEDKKDGNVRAKPISRTARRGPKIAFTEALNRMDLAWVDGNNIVINSGHPAYIKIRSSNSTRRLHCLFAIASAIQRFLNSQGEIIDPMFADRMMAAWGKK